MDDRESAEYAIVALITLRIFFFIKLIITHKTNTTYSKQQSHVHFYSELIERILSSLSFRHSKTDLIIKGYFWCFFSFILSLKVSRMNYSSTHQS